MTYQLKGKNKFKALLAAILAISCMMLLFSCGSGNNAVSSDVPSDSNDNMATVHNGTSQNQPVPDNPMERLAGRFYIDGDTSAASVVIVADGSFTAYYASGTVEQTGYVRYENDATNNSALNVFVFYTDEGKPYMGFVDSGEAHISEFETGNGSFHYIRADN